MYSYFRVRNYRCLKDLELNDLSRINLIAGMNNVGKTALLEALFIHCGAYNPSLAVRVDAFRGFPDPWLHNEMGSFSFGDFGSAPEVILEGDDSAGGRREVRLEPVVETDEVPIEISGASALLRKALKLSHIGTDGATSFYIASDGRDFRIAPRLPEPPFPAFFLSDAIRTQPTADAERFSRLEIAQRESIVLDFLRIIEPRLKRLTVVVTNGIPMLYGDIGAAQLVPLPAMGNGMARLATLVLHMANAQNGVALVDEIENGLHYSILSKVWEAIENATNEFNVQMFATTHSLECIRAAHEVLAKGETYDFRLHRLERIGDDIRVVTYDRDALEAAIETGLEVR